VLFIYSTILALTFPLLFPYWHILYFAPFLILCIYRHTFINCLWRAVACGTIIDLFSAETRLGIYALNYCIAVFFIYRFKKHFFEDKFRTLPVMTFCFSALSALIQVVIFWLMGKSFTLSWEWAASDLFFLPFQGAIYSLIAFSFPLLAYSNLVRRYKFL